MSYSYYPKDYQWDLIKRDFDDRRDNFYHHKYSYHSTNRYYKPVTCAPTHNYPPPQSHFHHTPLKLLPTSTCAIEPALKYQPVIPCRSKSNRHDTKAEDRKLTVKLGSLSLKGRRKCGDGGHRGHKDFHKHCHPILITPYHHHHCDPSKPKPKILDVSLCIPKNSVDHHTDKYEVCQEDYIDDITNRCSPAQLVVRRGQAFNVVVHLNRDYDKGVLIRLIATMGKVPLRSKGTHNEMVTGGTEDCDKDGKDWSLKVLSTNKNVMELAVFSPPNCAVGKWNLAFETTEANANGVADIRLMKESVNRQCYVLFNAWCKEDPVYMNNEDWRNEYVLNDSGKIYTGSHNSMYGKPWNFGQFESVTLEAVMYILNELTFISVTARGNPIVISRKLSALVNSSDDYGILTGRWDGNYCDGKNPSSWTGSVAILQKYMDTRCPVEYGQCWVFSGVMTTLCRALGIPTRSVTNFESAHDEDGSLTLDIHWDEHGMPMKDMNESIWNFHVWNECWMTRPDLGNEDLGGWQAVDSTPQEQSDGVYCAGPAPVAAIKSGNVGVSFDTPFIFAEVNADKIHWYRQPNGCIRTVVQKDVVGKNISTKAVGPSKDFSWCNPTPDREDITDQYKYPEGSSCERAAVRRAMDSSCKPEVPPVPELEDVTFTVEDIENIVMGSDFDIPIKIDNTSSQNRTVRLTVSLHTVYYTGIEKAQIMSKVYNADIDPNSCARIIMPVFADDYENCTTDGNHMQISYLGCVSETGQCYASQDNFRLRSVIPQMSANKTSVCVCETFYVNVQFTNPLRKRLTKCMFTFEAARNLKPTCETICDVGPGELVEAECEIKARRSGECVVIAAFECEQFEDVQAQCTVMVRR